jgi:hypothetical protein
MSLFNRIVVVLGAVAVAQACAPQSIDRVGLAIDRPDGAGAFDASDASSPAETAPPGTGGTRAVPPGTGGIGGRADGGGKDGPVDLAAERPPATGGVGPVDVGVEVVAEVAPPAVDGAAKIASLVVADPTANAAADNKLKTLLVALGFMVKIGDDDGLPTQSDGTRLVVLSGTCDSMKLLAKYRDYPLPTLVLEPADFDDMGLTLGTKDTDYGEVMATQIAITNMNSPLAAMFPAGNVTVTGQSSKLVWGKPAASAITVATLTGANNMGKAAVFAYEKGAMMIANVVAPARRMGMFASAPAIPNINANADKLLSAAMVWLAE